MYNVPKHKQYYKNIHTGTNVETVLPMHSEDVRALFSYM